MEEEKKSWRNAPRAPSRPYAGASARGQSFVVWGSARVFFRSAFPEGEGCGGFAVDVLQLSGGGIIPHRTAAVCPGEGARKGGGEGGETQRGDLERSTALTPKGCEAFHSPLLFLKGGGRKHKPCSQSSSFESSPASSPQAAELQPACAYIFNYIRASVRAASRDGLMGSGSSAGRPRPPRTAPRGRSASAPRCAPLRRSFWRGAKRGERHKREGRRESPSHAPLPQVYDGGPEE